MEIVNPFIFFCDDVREETNGKVSYIGVLGAGIGVESFPTTLHKICVGVGANVVGRESVAITFEITSDIDVNLPSRFEAEAPPPDDGTETWNLRVNLALNGVIVDQPAILTARIWFDDREVSTKLRISQGGALERKELVNERRPLTRN